MTPDDVRPTSLHEEDFYLWTQAQAEALRARGANRIDYDLLAEEVEDLGKRERREAMSRTGTILEHLYKLAWSQRKEPRGGWKATVAAQRRDLRNTLTPTLRGEVERALEELHRDAALSATFAFELVEPEPILDPSLRWTLAQILGEDNDPIA